MELSADKKTLIKVEFSDLDPTGAFIIPEGVTTIAYRAFEDCRSLTSITLPESVTEIRQEAFYNCTALTSITIPKGVTEIRDGAFACCRSLTSIIIPERVTEIRRETFYNCTALTSISIPNHVTKIGCGAFMGCESLTSINIPERVTEFGNYAFHDCSALTSISIPNRVTSIGEGAFGRHYCGCTSLTSVIISKNVTEIRYRTFLGCTGLTSISIPEGVTKIANEAFFDCARLTSITIPESVTEIGSYAFNNCGKLKNVIINSKDDSEFKRIKQLLRYPFKERAVPMSVYQAKQLKEQLLDDFCNQTSGVNPLDGHMRLPADVVGVISALSDEFSPANRLTKALDAVVMPTNDHLSEYEPYEMKLKQVQAMHIRLIPLYGLKNHLLEYKRIMETPKAPSAVRPIAFFNGPQPDEHSKYLPTWIRHQTLTKILDWIEKIIDSDPLLAHVPDPALSEEEKAAMDSSQLLMKDGIIPADFDFKAMLAQKEPSTSSCCQCS